jgi:hypothetical protein
MRTALIKDGKVYEIVIGGADYMPPPGVRAILSERANIGDNYDGRTFTSPAPPPQIAPKHMLKAHVLEKKRHFLHAGVDCNIAQPGQPARVIRLDNSANGRIDIMHLVLSTYRETGYKGHYVLRTGEVIDVDAAQIEAMHKASDDFHFDLNATAQQLMRAIDAGTVATLDEVDNPAPPLPAWPVSA